MTIRALDQHVVLLFGPQALSFDEKAFGKLREAVLDNPENRWVVDVIGELPTCWATFSERFPKLGAIPGAELLGRLQEWLNTGRIAPIARTLPNILLSPLVVITQLTQYTQYLRLRHPDVHGEALYNNLSRSSTEAVGFCTGLLSALAVSSSTDKIQFQKYATVAVRLATLIGAIVDSQDATSHHEGSESLAVVWNSPSTQLELSKILEQYPEAYTSVLYDENRATITTSSSSASSLQGKLRAAGIIASKVNLRGRFHSECYSADLDHLLGVCDADPLLSFPDASEAVTPIRSNNGGFITQGRLHHAALRSILIEQSRWHEVFSAVHASLLADKSATAVCFGPERCVPPSLIRDISRQLVYFDSLGEATHRLAQGAGHRHLTFNQVPKFSDNDIAVVGYALNVAGADDSEEFWRLLCEGKSQHVEVPPERVSFATSWRKSDPKRKWFGNFIRHPEAFDQKFFKKSPREVISQDPQQRLMMQVAYQAVEQSGYFNSPNADPNVGCYIGVCATDYENNIACHEPNAFSATGNLRSFIAGKISHYFNWTGPGLTIDSACSASAVSIHMACRAILGGECTAALAGGVNIMTNPLWFQNLAGASFLSPTGACKPFDAHADGYCRGEGIAAVFLKKASQAVADGDVILGNIAGTSVSQNDNCTPIFVPNTPSLSTLFSDVVSYAGLEPHQISVVEAHGTGTPVGDPAEYNSIRNVFGGSIRQQPMPIGSVKGLIGHTEGASGVIALIKILLMIQEGKIPPQASFQTLSPHIKASPSDMMEVVTRLKDWDVDNRAALINNYGASGSNASLVVTQPRQHDGAGSSAIHSEGLKHPFWLTGQDERSIREHAGRLRELIRSRSISANNITVANMSFNLYRQSNRNLGKGLMFSASSVSGLEAKLTGFINKDDSSLSVTTNPNSRPVVLCFGGQTSTFIALDRQVYDGVRVLRCHLDHCDSILKSMGLSGLYPAIFEKTPIEDTVKLQTALFSTQYAVAQTWIDCQVPVAAVVGHSFGELTALCVSGALSLREALRVISVRSRLVQDSWGEDRGSMMAIEGDLEVVQQLLAEGNKSIPDEHLATIACFNGPRSFTLAGSTKAIDAVVDTLSKRPTFSSMRAKRLNVTNAFHSTLVDPLISDLEKLGEGVTFNHPTIQLERATETALSEPLATRFFADHMRHPVYFNHAVQRLSQQYPSAIFLEAGSNSTITGMANKALGAPAESHFQAVNITSGHGLDGLTDTIVNIWKQGIKATFWPHHPSQTFEYGPVLLPPYQFEKNKHWLEAKDPLKMTEAAATDASSGKQDSKEEVPKGLFTFVGYQDEKQKSARFRINTETDKYLDFISGHLIAQTAPICPATLEVDMAIEAINNLQPHLLDSGYQPQIHNVENQSPICVDPSRTVWLDLIMKEAAGHNWGFKLVSSGSKGSSTTLHVSGNIVFSSTSDSQLQAQFSRYERLVGHQRCLNILDAQEPDDVILGRNIYKTFAEIVDYGEPYRGLHKLVGKGNESAGRVLRKQPSDTWLNAHLSDAFSQVGGIWVNCMTDRSPADMYIANGFEQWIRSPTIGEKYSEIDAFDVFAYHHNETEKAYVTDIFIFDSSAGSLVELILGVNYYRVAKLAMNKMLTRLSAASALSPASATTPSKAVAFNDASAKPDVTPDPKPTRAAPAARPKKQRAPSSAKIDVSNGVKAVLAELAGVELEEIKNDTDLPDIGIDSLMGMEMAKELEDKFKCSLSEEALVEVMSVLDLIKCVESVVSVNDTATSEDGDDDESYTDDDNDISSSSQNGELSDSMTSISEVEGGQVDVAGYLAEFIGVNEEDVNDDILLRDIGVDSLLSTELASELADKFGTHLSEDAVLEEFTVKELREKINGTAGSQRVATPSNEGRTHAPSQSGKTSDAGNPPPAPSSGGDLRLESSIVMDAFNDVKKGTDRYIADFGCADYLEVVNPKQVQMCVALIVEAFEQLGCPIREAKAGEPLKRIEYVPQHGRLVEYLYTVLERDARLIDINGGIITRTAVSPPSKSSQALLEALLQKYPNHVFANKLAYFTGTKLPEVLTGKSDGIKLIFGTLEGRELVAGLYGDSMLNKLSYKMMEDFLKRLVSKLPARDGPLKILEMGAGTGGTTKLLVPVLESLNIPVEYTYTDLSPSFTATARKQFKHHPSMKFRVHDIEKPPADDLIGTQHIVIASNAVHATHSLTESVKNIRKALRPDGFLMMLEMTEPLVWVDIIFGLLEGWWLFDDDRRHAISHKSKWEEKLQSVGFGHVDWTDGNRPETNIQRVIIAMASGPKYDRLPIPAALRPATESQLADTRSRQATIDECVRKYTNSFTVPDQASPTTTQDTIPAEGHVIAVTGATGSLGSHLVEHLANLPGVKTVVCVNRPNRESTADNRQRQALESRGIKLPVSAWDKLKIIESDTSKPYLGLPSADYQDLVNTVTHILHNAWPMSGKRPVKGFELQFQVLRNLIDFARDISSRRARGFQVGFQFVSSIATVGHYPLRTGEVNVPETRMTVESVLPNGYGDAKFICEKMLDETVHQYPDHFRPMAVRLGQIAGSKTSGYWNPQEHLSFLIKSSQTLRALPDFDGLLSWTPVNDVAATLSDLLLNDHGKAPYPIYHVDNPVRQQWRDVIPVLADALDIPHTNIVPFKEWVQRVRVFPGSVELDNPAFKLIEFLDDNFLRMSCGGLLLDTSKSTEHSPSLAGVGPVSDAVVRRYIQAWKEMGFLY